MIKKSREPAVHALTQSTFTCSKSTIEAMEQFFKSIQN